MTAIINTHTAHHRFLIVKINHLAERLEEQTSHPLVCHTAPLYRAAGGALHDGYLPPIADALADLRRNLPADARILADQLDDAVAELDTILQAAPLPMAPPVPVWPEPDANLQTGGLRQAIDRCRRIIGRRNEPDLRATRGLLAIAHAPSAR